MILLLFETNAVSLKSWREIYNDYHICIFIIGRYRKWRYDAVTIYRAETLFFRRTIDLNFLLTFRGVGRLIPSHFRPDGMPKSFTRVSRTKKKSTYLSIHRAGSFERRAPRKRGKRARTWVHVATIIPDSPHTCVRVRMHVAKAQERADLLRFSPGSLPQGDGDMCLSFFLFFFFFLTSRKTVGIRDMCVLIHTPRSWSAQGKKGECL